MKQLKLLLALVVSLFGMSSYAQDAADFTDGGEYYLQNVATGKFWGAGNNWGTRASLIANPECVILHKNGNTYRMESMVSNGGSAYFFNGDYMDNGSPVDLTITATGDGYYTVASGTNYFGYDGTSTVLGKNISATSENAKWAIFSLEEMVAKLSTATASAPVNATFAFYNCNFGRNNRHGNKSDENNDLGAVWTGSGVNNWSGGTNENRCAESYHAAFTLSQTSKISLPKGFYKLSAQGFYRQDGSNNTDLPYIYINSTNVGTFGLRTGSENSMDAASTSFAAGNYPIKGDFFELTEAGTMTIGAKLENNTTLWCIWDNFTLLYYGVEQPSIYPLYQASLQAAQAVDQTAAMYSGALTNLQGAISTYGSLTSSASEEALQAAIDALDAATNAANASIAAYAKANVTAYLAKMGGVLDLTNVYTQASYDQWVTNIESALNNHELTDDVASTINADGAYNGGWRSANHIDEVLLSAWTIGGNTVSDYNGTLYINTWSTEGNSDGSEMTTPFFEYWTGDGSSLNPTTIVATIPGLNKDKNYKVSAQVRVRQQDGNIKVDNGITFTVGDGNAVIAADGTEGTLPGDGKTHYFYFKTVTAYGNPDNDGNLTITFTVNADRHISWLSFNNVKYEESAITQAMINELYATIKTPHNILLDDEVTTTKAAVEAEMTVAKFSAFEAAVNAVNASAAEYAQVGAAIAEVKAVYATLIGLPSEEDTQYKAIMTLAELAYEAGEIESQTDPRINSCTKALTLLEQGIRLLVIHQKAEGAVVNRGFPENNLSGTDVTTGNVNVAYDGLAPWMISESKACTWHVNTWSGEGATDGSGLTTPFMEYWVYRNATLDDVTISNTLGSQTLGGDPVHLYENSVYEVSGLIRVAKEEGTEDLTGVSIFCGDFEKDLATEGTQATTSYGHALYGTFTIKGNTDANGHLTFGIKTNGTNANWVGFKNFTIKYVSDNVDDLYKDAYEKMLAKAQADIADEANANIGGAAKAALASEIANEPNVPGTITYKDGYDQLKAADEAFLAAKEVWDDLAAAISEATTANETYNDAALATEITTAQNLKASDSATNSDATEEAATLRAAIEAAKQFYIAKEKYYNLYAAIQASCVDTEDDVYTDVDGALATLTTAMSDTKAAVDAATTIAAVEENYNTLRAAGVTFVNAVDIHFEKYFDVTWVMVNPDFDTVEGQDNRWWNQTDNSTVIDGWTFTNSGNQYVRNAWNNCEAYECDFDIHQTITGMPVGFYELHVSAFQRRGNSNDVYEAYINNYEGDYANRKVSSVIYLNEEETTIKCICDEHSDALIYTGTSTFGQEGDVQPAENFWIPNGMDGSNAWFAKGYYDNKVYVKVPDGNLTVGFKSGTDGYQGGDWTIFDNFRLYFYGSSLTIEMSENETTNLLAMENQHVKLTRTITASTGENISYNTLVLPFDVTAEKLQAAFGSDVKVYAYDGNEGNSVKFSEATTISANVPVLLTTSTASTDEPYIFQNVDIQATAGGAVASGLDGTIEFVGTYAAETPMNGKYFFSGSKIYLGTDQSQKMKGTRAYLTDNSGSVNALSLDIDGTEITAIQGIDGTISVPKAIYNLQGQKVTNPVKGGIYIIDGKKVLVK